LPFLRLWFSLDLISWDEGAVLIIYTESDYLEAHLTEISHDSNSWSTAIDTVPQRLSDAFKKFTSSDSDPRSSSKSHPSKPRNS